MSLMLVILSFMMVAHLHYLIICTIEEAKIRSIEGLATSQPLAKLLPRLLGTQRLANNELNVTSIHQSVNIPNPQYMRMHIDNTLVETLKQVLTTNSSEDEAIRGSGIHIGKKSKVESNPTKYIMAVLLQRLLISIMMIQRILKYLIVSQL